MKKRELRHWLDELGDENSEVLIATGVMVDLANGQDPPRYGYEFLKLGGVTVNEAGHLVLEL